jgi:hypothetical protein
MLECQQCHKFSLQGGNCQSNLSLNLSLYTLICAKQLAFFRIEYVIAPKQGNSSTNGLIMNRNTSVMVMSFTCVQGYWDWVKQYTPKSGMGRQAEAEMSQA